MNSPKMIPEKLRAWADYCRLNYDGLSEEMLTAKETWRHIRTYEEHDTHFWETYIHHQTPDPIRYYVKSHQMLVKEYTRPETIIILIKEDGEWREMDSAEYAEYAEWDSDSHSRSIKSERLLFAYKEDMVADWEPPEEDCEPDYPDDKESTAAWREWVLKRG